MMTADRMIWKTASPKRGALLQARWFGLTRFAIIGGGERDVK